MSHRNPSSGYTGAWDPQGCARTTHGYPLSATGYQNRAVQAATRGSSMAGYHHHSHHSHQPDQSLAAPYPYTPIGAESMYMQNPNPHMSSGEYTRQTATHGYNIAYQTGGYSTAYSPQCDAVSVGYTTASMAQGSSVLRMGTNINRNPNSSSLFKPPPPPPPSIAPGHPAESSPESIVPCPYNCGTVLTGIHAVGNMTRHLKSQNCVGSGREKPRYACRVEGCEKRYMRSDGLKVHLRKRHGISQAADAVCGG